MQSFRKHGRELVKFAVTFKHRELGDITVETRDVSETGVFVNCKDLIPHFSIGDEITAKLHRDCENESQVVAKVVRLTNDGIGLAY